jgi:DNA-binding response OmpR family regulator
MNIACLTDSRQLSDRIERAVAELCHHFAAYQSVTALAQGLAGQRHEVLLLSGSDDLIDTFLACPMSTDSARQPMTLLLSERDCGGIVERALAAGVDDYVSIASGFAQLAPRIRACAGRRQCSDSDRNTLRLHDIELDRRDGSARLRGMPIDLTGREFLLAWILFSNARRLVTVRAIAEAVWGTSADIAKRTIEQHVYRLRVKLRLRSADGWCLTTVYGKGYRLDESAAGEDAADVIALPPLATHGSSVRNTI